MQMTAKICWATFNGEKCDRVARRPKRGLCGAHEAQARRGVPFAVIREQAYGGRPAKKRLPCEFEGCEKPQKLRGLCAGHAEQRNKGQALRPLRRWEPHPWLGGGWGAPRVFASTGYAYVYRQNPPSKRLEHRVVMEHIIGRPLFPDENIHHLNGDRSDNRPENLELWSVMQPTGQRIDDKVKFALEILSRYAPDRLA